MHKFEIRLQDCLDNDITINELLLLFKLDYILKTDGNDVYFPLESTTKSLDILIEKGLVHDNNGSISLSKKGFNIVNHKEIVDLALSKEINFDEIFFLYPYVTPSGRKLRPKNKTSISGKIESETYSRLKKKYLTRIRSLNEHKDVIKRLTRMINDTDCNYLPELQTTINQSKWELFEPIEDLKTSKSLNMTINSSEDFEF